MARLDYQNCILRDLIGIEMLFHFNFSQDWLGIPYSDLHPLQPLRLENFLHLRQLVPQVKQSEQGRLVPRSP